MAEIISQGHRETAHRWYHKYLNLDAPGAAYSFECDEQGNFISEFEPARENYRKCVSGEYNVAYAGIEHESWTYWEPTVIRCQCGRNLSLDSSWANTCDCGREYNGFGQLLAPRSQWFDEDPGENEADVFNGREEDW